MNKEIEELKENTEKLLNHFSINVMNGEAEILNQFDIFFRKENININIARKFVKNIEKYLEIKEKINIKQEEIKDLKELANKLRREIFEENV